MPPVVYTGPRGGRFIYKSVNGVRTKRYVSAAAARKMTRKKSTTRKKASTRKKSSTRNSSDRASRRTRTSATVKRAAAGRIASRPRSARKNAPVKRSRQGPAAHAADFALGARMPGKRGVMWKIILVPRADGNSYKRWSKVPESEL